MQYTFTWWYYHVHFGVCFQKGNFIIENSRTSSTHLIRVKKTNGYPTVTKIYNSFLIIHTHFRTFLKDTLFSHIPIMCFCHCLFMKSCRLCDPMTCSPPGSSVHGISQARILEWVVVSFSTGSSWPRDQTQICLAGELFTTEPPGKSLLGTKTENSIMQDIPNMIIIDRSTETSFYML